MVVEVQLVCLVVVADFPSFLHLSFCKPVEGFQTETTAAAAVDELAWRARGLALPPWAGVEGMLAGGAADGLRWLQAS